MRTLAMLAMAACGVVAAMPCHAVLAWDETLRGDLSSDGLAPTALSFVAGANTVIGTMGAGDIDYFSFTVPQGWQLSAIQVNPGTSVAGAASFIAIQAGPRVTVTPGGGGTGPASLLAFGHYDASDVGSNLLARLLPQSAGLQPGTYSVWLNETAGSTPYSFDFVFAPVPEPASILLLGVGLLAMRKVRRA